MKQVIKLALLSLVLLAPPSSADEPYEYQSFDMNKIQGTKFHYVSGGGSDRCHVDHCLCKVVPPTTTTPTATSRVTSRRYSVFFSEASSAVSSNDVRVLEEYIDDHRKLRSSYTVVGYTDDCGTHSYNMSLVKERSTAVKQLMLKNDTSRVELTIFNPESGFGHNPASRRVDIIAHTANRVTTMIEKVQADVYLIDASGSMWNGWKGWQDVIAVSFRPGSRVYLSKTSGCFNGQLMKDVDPAGGTEIWYSYWKIIEWMKPGETLAVVSDFMSSVPLTRREASLIEQKAREKKIKVIAISP